MPTAAEQKRTVTSPTAVAVSDKEEQYDSHVKVYNTYVQAQERLNVQLHARSTAIAKETGLPDYVSEFVVELADKYDFYEETIVGMINLESKYNIMSENWNTNGTVDRGLMQINSNTLPWLAKQIGKPNADPFDPIDNLEMGVWYIDYLRDTKSICNGSLDCALARYNGDSSGLYKAVVRDRIQTVASRMGIDRIRNNKGE